MSTNRGKDFENIVRSSISNLGIDITRLYDSTSGYISIHTTCDFIAYKYPTIYYIECKSIDGNTLSSSSIAVNSLSTKAFLTSSKEAVCSNSTFTTIVWP